MGSSKKHKDKDRDREHKRKRKHRSRSRSREKESKRRHRERSEEARGQAGTHGGYPGREGREPGPGYDYYQGPDREEGEIEDPYAAPVKQEDAGNSGENLSLSIEETNKLRAKLGLKPLEVTANKPDLEKESLKDDIHKPALSLTKERETQKIKEKLERSKKRREINDRLNKIKTLGDSDSDEDAATWVRKNRMKQRERDKAEKTAKMLADMDEEFGIGNLVEEEFASSKPKGYSSKHLKGLKVQHDMESFKEGQTVILTLQDKGVLDDEDEETLVNVNMIDDERAALNVENRKGKPAYTPYDEAEEDEYGIFKPKEVLSKYDEEIEGKMKKSFKLASGGAYNAEEDRQMDRIKEQLRAQSQTLSVGLKLNTEYMTTDEAQAKFKKVKKKVRKIRKKKMLKADDLLPLGGDTGQNNFGSRIKQEPAIPGLDFVENGGAPVMPTASLDEIPQIQEPDPDPESHSESEEDMQLDPQSDEEVTGPDVDLTGVVVDDEAENELQSALNKARKLKQKKDVRAPDRIAQEVLLKQEEEDEEGKGINITMNATSEFCRALGEIPTYGQSGNRDEMEKDELQELEQELLNSRRKMEEDDDEELPGWNRVEIDETPVNITSEETAILEDEPVLSAGIGGALSLAVNKGFLEHEQIKPVRLSKQAKEMLAQNYTIEDKRYDDLDEKYKKRDRYSGMLSDFKEKDSYKPEVKLEYCDETGRNLNQKEAFRQLSHRFHGKGSGKKKTEKRSKKVDEEHLMKKMSATDTPLNTVAMLVEKQQQEKTPYIVLSGNKGFTHTMVKPANR